MKSKYLLLAGFLISLGLSGFTQSPQVSITRLDVQSSFSQGSLGNVELLNHEENELRVYLMVQLQSTEGRNLREKSQTISLKPGLSSHDLSGLQISNPNYLLQQTEKRIDRLEICLEVFLASSQEKLASQCEQMVIEPMMPPYLVYPFDKEALANPLPVFTWTPPAPIPAGKLVTYRIRVVELRGIQSAIVAVNQSPAILEEHDLIQTTLPYPIGGATLQVGLQYAWQIEAFCEGRSLGKSEVWTFFLEEEEEEETPDPKPFVELKMELDAGFYPAYGLVKFRFDRNFGEQSLQYAIYNEAHEEQEVKSVEIERVGDNRYILALPANCGLEDQTFYLLGVTDARGKRYWLRFKFFST